MTDTATASQRPWRVVADAIHPTAIATIFDDNSEPVLPYVNGRGVLHPHTAALICDAVNLKARIDEAMADESGYLHPVALDGKPKVCVTPPPSEAEESRMHREYETGLLVDRERFRRCYYEAEERNDRLRDIVRRLCDELEGHYYEPQSMNDHSIIREARAAIGEGE